jgi:ABC-type transport system involved in cytochrome bd biosynthesis fused ATPase/permease subunit
LRDAPLLLMDEPAAHLDPASARQIGEALETVLADRTVILVSHGRGWASQTGRIISLDHGKLLSPYSPEPPAGRSPAVIR